MIISIPLYIILIPYALFLLGFAFFAFFAIYHLIRFGFKTFSNFLMMFVFLGVTVIVLFVSYQMISEINWFNEVQILELTGASQYF